MVKSKNIIAGLGVVAGLGMALLPLGAFAATEGETAGHVVRAHVGEVIEIDVTNITNRMSDVTSDPLYNHSRVAIEPGNTVDATTEHTVQVKSNARGGYQLLMKADRANLELISEYNADGTAKTYNSSIKIPAVAAAGDTLETNAGWGYKIKAGSGSYGDKFLPVPTAYASGEGATIAEGSYRTGTSGSPYRTETAEYTDTYTVGFGVKAAADQPSGSYEATITYKAIAHVLGDA